MSVDSASVAEPSSEAASDAIGAGVASAGAGVSFVIAAGVGLFGAGAFIKPPPKAIGLRFGFATFGLLTARDWNIRFGAHEGKRRNAC